VATTFQGSQISTAGISTTSARSWKSSTRGWHHNNISTKLEIFSTRLASQQHQHEAGNLHHEAGITTTSARSWKSSARDWHHNNISTKLEILCTRLASKQHQHEAGNLQHKVGINILWYSDRSKGFAQESKDSLGYKILTLLTKASIYMHKYSDNPSLRTFGICPGMISPLGYKNLTELPAIGQDTIVSSALLPLLRKVLSDCTKLVLKVLKLYTRQRLGQHICNLFICANIMELYGSSLHHITNEVRSDLYVLLAHHGAHHLYTTMVIT
jgi:hypothetical protein